MHCRGNLYGGYFSPQLRGRIGLRANFHAFFNRRRAGCGKALATLDLDNAQAAGAECLHIVGGTKFWYVDTGLAGGSEYRGPGSYGRRQPVNLDIYGFRKRADGSAKIGFFI